MDTLLNKIRQRANDPNTIHDMAEGLSPAPKINAVISLAEIEKTEAQYGFKFPALFKEIYTKIGNGGFGPGYGLYSFEQAKEIYDGLISNDENEWESGTWPLCTWGCAIDSYLDCADPELSVYFTNTAHSSYDGDDNPVSFTFTDSNGNVISSGSGGNISSVLDQLSGHKEEAPASHSDDDDDEDEEDEEETGLTFHKEPFSEWMNDWADGISLWDEMYGEDEEEDEEDEDDNITNLYNSGPPDGRGR